MARDYTKYLFEGEKYCKNRLVLAVVRKYLEDNPATTFDGLKKIFPDNLNRHGVFQTCESAGEGKRGGKIKAPERRFFMEPTELLLTGDGKEICVCSQWGDSSDRHREFVEYCRKELKYKIEPLPSKTEV